MTELSLILFDKRQYVTIKKNKNPSLYAACMTQTFNNDEQTTKKHRRIKVIDLAK